MATMFLMRMVPPATDVLYGSAFVPHAFSCSQLPIRCPPNMILRCRVLYTLDGCVVFLQISISAYAQHRTKLPQLISKTMEIINSAGEKETTAMYEAYYRLCKRTAMRKTVKFLPKDAYYVYVTLSEGAAKIKDKIVHLGPKNLLKIGHHMLTGHIHTLQ